MRFVELAVSGAYRVLLERLGDARGFFARCYCESEFSRAGLPTEFVQASLSFSDRRGTVRGLHFQWPPSREGKLVRCIRGAIHDVLLDLRPHCPTYLKHVAIELNADNREAVFIPPGVAHGFQTLADSSEVYYQMTDRHAPELAAGLRWNDPAFGIHWPIQDDVVVSQRDANCPDFRREAFEVELARHGNAWT